jgi:hypothetical protein
MGSEREEALIRETLSTWQGHYPIPLSKDDAQQIITNITDFFTLLHEWDQQSNAACTTEHADEKNTGGEHDA